MRTALLLLAACAAPIRAETAPLGAQERAALAEAESYVSTHRAELGLGESGVPVLHHVNCWKRDGLLEEYLSCQVQYKPQVIEGQEVRRSALLVTIDGRPDARRVRVIGRWLPPASKPGLPASAARAALLGTTPPGCATGMNGRCQRAHRPFDDKNLDEGEADSGGALWRFQYRDGRMPYAVYVRTADGKIDFIEQLFRN